MMVSSIKCKCSPSRGRRTGQLLAPPHDQAREVGAVREGIQRPLKLPAPLQVECHESGAFGEWFKRPGDRIRNPPDLDDRSQVSVLAAKPYLEVL